MEPARTVTGQFPIGLRQGGGTWRPDPEELVRWAAGQGFGCVDFRKEDALAGLSAAQAAGLVTSTVDLFGRQDYEVMIAPDTPARRAGIAAASTYIEQCAAAGATVFFAVTIPSDPGRGRRQNFDGLAEMCAALVPTLEGTDTRLALEGWPGPGAVCCTPETFRALFATVRSDRVGINYDPSHLVRMGIDPLRFAREFAGQIFHVHAKDAAVSEDELYEYGHELPPTFRPARRWGGAAWRYTVPGQGNVLWRGVFAALSEAGYRGLVSVELEDENFHGTAADEQRGLILAREFLENC